MASNSPKRPTTLSLPTSHRTLKMSSQQHPISFMDFMPELSLRRAFAVLNGHDSGRGIKRSKCFHILIILVIILTLIIYKPRIYFRERSSRSVCKDEHIVYFGGKIVCYQKTKMKYLTYQPPGGGWNNQRIALENAVLLARLLNRTLIVHPMAPHQDILRIKKLGSFRHSYEAYNMVPTENLIALSKVIDISRLSKLLPVKEIFTNHTSFINDYHHLSWFRVCHNGLVGAWVDSLPDQDDKDSWEALELHTKSFGVLSNLPSYRRSCQSDMSKYTANKVPVWGILDELSHRTEDILYFEEGSMYFRNMLFLSRKRTQDAHKWLIRYVTFAPQIWRRLRSIKQQIRYPYNAVHVRRTDHPSSRNITQDYWLSIMNKKQLLNITSKLYVATDEKNATWFQPFRDAGFHLYFAKDFAINLEVDDEKSAQDILGLTEQIVCAHANEFVGSYYSTFTMFIKRLRKHTWWRGQLLHKPYFVVTWVNKNG